MSLVKLLLDIGAQFVKKLSVSTTNAFVVSRQIIWKARVDDTRYDIYSRVEDSAFLTRGISHRRVAGSTTTT